MNLAKNTKGPPNATALIHKEKILPIIVSKTMDWFSLNDCNYAIQKCKETTGRVSMPVSLIRS